LGSGFFEHHSKARNPLVGKPQLLIRTKLKTYGFRNRSKRYEGLPYKEKEREADLQDSHEGQSWCLFGHYLFRRFGWHSHPILNDVNEH
jgi:hypothetical protein